MARVILPPPPPPGAGASAAVTFTFCAEAGGSDGVDSRRQKDKDESHHSLLDESLDFNGVLLKEFSVYCDVFLLPERRAPTKK